MVTCSAWCATRPASAFPFSSSSIDAHASKVKGLQQIPTGGLMGYNFAQYVWLDS